MKTIGIRDLKAGLSRALRDVAAGETYLVTDRGHVVAELRRPDATPRSPQDLALARLVATGYLRVAERANSTYTKSPLRVAKGLAQALLDEERGD